MHYGVIMAGGSGTRLWPMSCAQRPKQLLNIVGGKCLLRLSFERLLSFLPPERIYVCTSAAHRQMVLEQLPEMPAGNLLGEPCGRDTVNAVAFPAAIIRRRDPQGIMAVVTADHVIEPVPEFARCIQTGFAVAEARPHSLVTFGIVPTSAHTGLGYVQRGEALALPGKGEGIYHVRQFKEKPDQATAEGYLASGEYFWNSGMFVWRCDTFLQELKAQLPESAQRLDRIAAAWDTPAQEATLQEVYPQLKKISVDYAIMEPAARGQGKASVVTVAMPVRWLDVGSWPTLAAVLHKDGADNAVEGGPALLVDSRGNIIVSDDPQHLVSALGVDDMIIIHTRKTTLVCPRSKAEGVKSLVDAARQQHGERFL
jgi:mannose-1-phosphate guanylyltransferase